MAMTTTGLIRKRVITPAASEVLFETRGFEKGSAPAKTKLEMSGLQFIIGFEFAIEHKDLDSITLRLEALPQEYQGFAYEGAAMALSIRDAFRAGSGDNNLERFLAGPDFHSGPGSKHIFMAYIGVGFALARLPRMMWSRAIPDPHKLADHPTLNWLAMDGYGFHMAYFQHRKWVDRQYVAKRPYPWPGPADYTNRVIDQGIGRAMWFIYGGDVGRLLTAIDGFAPARRSDLISGAGLAASYAGGVGEDALEQLLVGSGAHRAEVAQGAVFALRARVVAEVVTPHNESAARVLCGMTAQEASDIAAKAIVDLPPDGAVPAYEVFRQRIQEHFR